MLAKTGERLEALRLRERGLSYSEIKKQVSVSGSSLSLWLRGVKLDGKQKLRLIEKGKAARKLGSGVLKRIRVDKTQVIIKKASLEVGNLDNSDLMLAGIMLYWAEGSKQKEHNPSKEVIFSNSDPEMIRIYLRWVRECLKIPEDRIVFETYIHETHKKTIHELALYWSKITGFPIERFGKVYFKKNKVSSFRKNRGKDYSGVLRVSIRKSTDLNRKITGWIKGVSREFLG